MSNTFTKAVVALPRTLIPIALLFQLLYGQGVAINGSGASPDPSAMLDVQSTTQGMLIPRMSSAERNNISSAAEGLMVYDLDTHSPWTYSQSQWQQLQPLPAGTILWRASRSDVEMAQAGFSYMADQALDNGISVREWQNPAPSSIGAPAARSLAQAFWTGSHMLVLGGSPSSSSLDGGAYNATQNTWSTISTAGVPSNLFSPSMAVASGGFYVWGGELGLGSGTQTNAGYLYDANQNTWTSLSVISAPSVRKQAAATSIGSRLLVWGGVSGVPFFGGTYPSDGGIYDPSTDSWTAISSSGAPQGRVGAFAFSSDQQVLIWGGMGQVGFGTGTLYDGGVYDLNSSSWSAIQTAGAPDANYSIQGASLVGKRMVILTIENTSGLVTPFVYDLTTDTWTMGTQASSVRVDFSLAWTGNGLIIWGGRSNSTTYFNDGLEYDLSTDSWTTFNLAGAPTARSRAASVWTGDQLLIFGGLTAGNVNVQDPAALISPGKRFFYLYQKN